MASNFKPAFMPVPVRAMRDKHLTALELRVLGCICSHDRFSVSKNGKGCYARNQLMADEVDCTVTSLSRAIGILVKRGYIERDYARVLGKRHMTVYRVIYGEGATFAQRGKFRLPEEASVQADLVAQDGREIHKTFARNNRENDANVRLVRSQENFQKKKIESIESEDRRTEKMRFAPRGSPRCMVLSAFVNTEMQRLQNEAAVPEAHENCEMRIR